MALQSGQPPGQIVRRQQRAIRTNQQHRIYPILRQRRTAGMMHSQPQISAFL